MTAGKLKLRNGRCSRLTRSLIAATAIALAMLGVGAASAPAQEPIVGLWEITVTGFGPKAGYTDNVFTGWTTDGLEFDQDVSPQPGGVVCYGHWIKLKSRTYGLTHPYFDFDLSTGIWAGTSGYLNYVVTVSKDGSTFTGVESGIDGVSGPNPYTGSGGSTFNSINLSATKIEVNKSLLP